MNYKCFVIKQAVRGSFVYMPSRVFYEPDEDFPCENWSHDPYSGYRFKSLKLAEEFLQSAFTVKHWGGVFEITQLYVNQ